MAIAALVAEIQNENTDGLQVCQVAFVSSSRIGAKTIYTIMPITLNKLFIGDRFFPVHSPCVCGQVSDWMVSSQFPFEFEPRHLLFRRADREEFVRERTIETANGKMN